MPRYLRNTTILAKVEVTPGTDVVPVVGSDAVLAIEGASITPLEANLVPRNLLRGYFGGSEHIPTHFFSRCQFSVELAGSSVAATAPQWGDLLLACAMAESLLGAPNRVEYTPVSSALKTLTIYYFHDGVRHIMNYCMGNVKLSAKVGEVPRLMFDFIGREGTISATAAGATTLTAWKLPVGMAAANVVDLTLGCTYSAGALSGGTVYPSTGLELDFGNQVAYTPLLSSDRVDISQREITGKISRDLTAAQEVTDTATIKAATTTGLGLTIGLAAGNKIIIHMPAVQLLPIVPEDVNGSLLTGNPIRAVPVASGSGNDEIRIVTQ